MSSCFSTTPLNLSGMHPRQLVKAHWDLFAGGGLFCFVLPRHGLGLAPGVLLDRRRGRLHRFGFGLWFRLGLGCGDGNGQVVGQSGVGGQQRCDVRGKGVFDHVFGGLVWCGEEGVAVDKHDWLHEPQVGALLRGECGDRGRGLLGESEEFVDDATPKILEVLIRQGPLQSVNFL